MVANFGQLSRHHNFLRKLFDLIAVVVIITCGSQLAVASDVLTVSAISFDPPSDTRVGSMNLSVNYVSGSGPSVGFVLEVTSLPTISYGPAEFYDSSGIVRTYGAVNLGQSIVGFAQISGETLGYILQSNDGRAIVYDTGTFSVPSGSPAGSPVPPRAASVCGGDAAVGTGGNSTNAPSQAAHHPIYYSDGSVLLSEVDLASSAMGGYTFTRSFSNQSTASFQDGIGNSWIPSQLPSLVKISSVLIARIRTGTAAVYYDYNSLTGVGTPHFYSTSSLLHNSTLDEYTETDSVGTTTTFYGFIQTAHPPGALKQMLDAFGNTSTVTYHGGLATILRTAASSSIQEEWNYTYVVGGVNDGLIDSVSYVRSTDGSTFGSIIRLAKYSYYDGFEAYGNQGDLKFVAIEDGADGQVGTHILDMKYYRYYTPTDHTTGYIKGLKYVVGPQSCERLRASLSLGIPTNPSTIFDSVSDVSGYADNYFEYNSSHQATKEIAQGAGCSCSGSAGQGTYLYDRCTTNMSGTYTDDTNKWKQETVETLPDLNQNLVFTNYAGQVILEVHRIYADPTNYCSGHTDYPTYCKYDSNGRLLLKAEPSAFQAVSGAYWNPAKDDLLDFSGVHSPYLYDSAGKVHTYTYGSSTTASLSSAGDVAGYDKAEFIQEGATGTAIELSSQNYYEQTYSGGPTIYPLASTTVYRNTGGAGGETTSYAYAWYSGTNAIKTRTTTKPLVATGQNGPGGSANDTIVEYFDTFGHVIWTKDADGYITYNGYDILNGAIIQTVTDADTSASGDFLSTDSVPVGLSSPSGTRLRLKSVYSVDSFGRTTALTDPRGNITYTVYDDPDHEVRVYPGWNTSTNSPTGPTQVMREDRANSYNETFTMTATPSVSSGVPTGTESIGSIQTLSRTMLDQSNRPAAMDRFFKLSSLTYSTTAGLNFSTGVIAELGTLNTNYYRTTYGYDGMGRRNRVVNAVGDIARTVYDGLGRVTQTWLGTDDGSGTWNGTNAGTENLVQLSQNIYDDPTFAGTSGTGDGILSESIVYTHDSGSTTRKTQMYYDWRDRMVATKSGVSTSETDGVHRPIMITDLDNLGEATTRYRYDGDGLTISVSSTGIATTSDSSKLRAETVASYDDQGRMYQSQTYSVDQSAGTLSSNTLTTNTFYDHRGNMIATYSPGGIVRKSFYDGAGRLVETASGDGATDSGWSSASSLSGNNVLEESLYTYDNNGNAVLTVAKSRNHDETSTGELGTPTTSPKARVTYATAYYDIANRLTASVAYGTNGGTAVSAPTGSAPSSSDTVLVTGTAYNSAGWANAVTDPKGLVTQTTYDAAGRVTQTIEDYTDGTPTAATNRKTTYTYDGLDHTLTLTAVMPSGTNSQTTAYTYGVTTSGSSINSNSLLSKVAYPDKTAGTASTSTGDQNTFTYDALGEVTTKTDQNGSVHTYSYDVLGRTIKDAATTLASGVDSSVKAIGINFDTAGRPYQLTSYSDTAATTAVNQVQRAYNGLGQLTAEYQNHSSTVTTSSDPMTQYAYTEMASAVNNSRLTAVTYPNGRVVDYLYLDAGDASGVSNAISRITAITTSSSSRGTNDANVLASYDYLGLSTVVRKNYPIPGLRLDRFGGTSGTYAGLDQFNRVINQEWTKYSVSTGVNTSGGDIFKIGHGYDRDSNRLYADNSTQPGTAHSYAYDNLNRLTTDKSGSLNTGKTDVLANQGRNDSWSLDPLGNPTALSTLIDAESSTVNAQNQIITRTVGTNAATGVLDDSSTLYQGPPGVLSSDVTFPGGASSGTISLEYGQTILTADISAQTLTLSVNGTNVCTASASITAGTPFTLSMIILPNYVTFAGAPSVYYEPTISINPSVAVDSSIAGATFGPISGFNPAVRSNMWGRWESGTTPATSDSGSLWPAPGGTAYGAANLSPVLLKDLRLQKFQADFQLWNSGGGTSAQFVFDAKDDYNWKSIELDNLGADQLGHQMINGGGLDYVDGTNDYDNVPSVGGSVWVRVTSDGSTLTVREAATQGGLDTVDPCYTSTHFLLSGGQIGFADFDGGEVSDVTIKSYSTTTTSFSVTETVENFALDSSFNGVDTLAYDNNGNLTYDGLQSYTYDAWNQVKTVAHAYTVSGGTPQHGTPFEMLSYDGMGRRIKKQMGHMSGTSDGLRDTGAMDATYHDYYCGQSVIEERNFSNQSIKDHVWGLSYVDEAVQTRVNTNPTGTASWTSYWLCQDANYNMLGIVSSSGVLTERYEYSAYGQRQVFVSSGSNDPGCYTPSSMSGRVVASGSIIEPWGINDVGHQGLMHDEEDGLVYNRARMLNPTFDRFNQEEPFGASYVDSLNLYEPYGSHPVGGFDPSGLDYGLWYWTKYGLFGPPRPSVPSVAAPPTSLASEQDGAIQRAIDQANINAGRSPSGQIAGIDNSGGTGTLKNDREILNAGGSVTAAAFEDAALLLSLTNPVGEDALTAKIAEELAAAGLKAVRIGGKAVLQSLKDGSIICDDAAKAALNDAKKASENASKIDRSAFKAEREGYWKAEAQNNPGNYSADDLARMKDGRAPIGPDGYPIELHHVDRTPEGGVTPMSRTDHRLGDNYKKNHP